jgi:hypothetical protein
MAIAGVTFFLIAIGFLLFRQPEHISYATIICGAIVEAISALNFYLYGRASNQLRYFHHPLDRMQRFILANDIASSLEEKREETKAKLALTIIYLPVPSESQKEQIKRGEVQKDEFETEKA